MATKVKYFATNIVHDGGGSILESEINNWLEINHTYHIIDIKLTESLAAAHDKDIIFYATALIIYRSSR